MGTLFKSTSQAASSTGASEDPNEHSEEILDCLINSGTPKSIGSINPPVLASYAVRFSDLIKLSTNALKISAIISKSQKISSNEAVDAKKSVNNKENDIDSRKKAAKTKATRGSQSSRCIAQNTLKFHELSSPKQEIKDFFGSLNWYESNKSYYDKRLQLVLDDFESSDLREKQYHHYLLLDSRVAELAEWQGFIRAVFFVGKGKSQRAFDHCIKEAANVWMSDGRSTSKKVSRILDIWRGEGAVILLTTADDLVECEANTHQALVIEALEKQRLCNKNLYGSFHGVAVMLKAREKHELGATLLVKARERFIKDGANCVFAPVRLENS